MNPLPCSWGRSPARCLRALSGYVPGHKVHVVGVQVWGQACTLAERQQRQQQIKGTKGVRVCACGVQVWGASVGPGVYKNTNATGGSASREVQRMCGVEG
eukprot:365337-Chlamydomonas_euryale.AAC.3